MLVPGRIPVVQVVVPDDQVVSLAGADVVRTVSEPPQMDHGAADPMLVPVPKMPMVTGAHNPTKRQAGSLKAVTTKADVQGHITGVRVEADYD